MTNPLNPNFKPGVGRLATDRYDFASHIEGVAFQHTAGQIVLSPPVTIGINTVSDVQTAIAQLSGTIVIPTVPNATRTSTGVIQLGGDLSALTSTALAPIIGSLQGTALGPLSPLMNQVLQWNGSSWVNAYISPATTTSQGTIILSNGISPATTGDLGNVYNNVKVIALQGFPVSNSTPTSGQVLAYNGSAWAPASASGTPQATASTQGTIQLGGDLAGSGSSATAPRTSGLNGASVPVGSGLTTGNVLQVSGSAALSYGYIADANVATAAAIQGTKISPAFGSQALSTTGTAALGATTITGALVAGASTAVNSLTGSWAVTTRTITGNLTVDSVSTDYIILVNASSSLNITLPLPTNGRRLIVKDIAGTLSSTVLINMVQHASEKIEGLAATKALGTPWGSWTFVSNGTDWFMI